MRWIDLGDVRLRLREYGAGDPVLLVHGLGSSGEDWAFQIGPLAARHRVLVPDLRGCGASSTPVDGYRIEVFADDLWRLLDRLGIACCAIIGFSMGGAVALEMALQRPHAVSRLVTINSLPSYRIDHWRKGAEYWLQRAMVRLLGMRRTAGIVARRLFPWPQQAGMRARVVAVVGSAAPAPYLRCAAALAAWCAAERLDRLQAPLLMLAGEHDYTPLDEKHAWAQRLGATLQVIAGSRHGTPFDAILACNATLTAFLADAPLPEGLALALDPVEAVPQGPPALPAERRHEAATA